MQRNEEQQDVFAFTADSTQYIDPFAGSEEAPQQEVAAADAPESVDSFALPPKQDEGVVEECLPTDELPEGWTISDGVFTEPGGMVLLDMGGFDATMTFYATIMGGKDDLDFWLARSAAEAAYEAVG
jgi:hypothetical protein